MIYNSENNTLDWDKLKDIPEIDRLKNIPQNEQWHLEGNAYVHTCMVTQTMIDYIDNSNDCKFEDPDYRTILVFSALLHDVGKGNTTILGEDGLHHCPKHAIESFNMCEYILNTYDFGINPLLKDSIKSLVRYHMQPLYLAKDASFTKSLFKLLNKLDKVSFEELLILKECDVKGSINTETNKTLIELNNVRKTYEHVYIPSYTKVKIKKLEDLIYEGQHPNSINVGYEKEGILFVPVTIGWRTKIQDFSTSPVIKIIDKNHFQTENSIYEIIEI